MEVKSTVRNKFKTPEGRYDLVAERNQNTAVFHYQRCTRLCLATLQLGTAEDGQYLLYNVGEFVYINRATNIHKEPIRSLPLGSSTVRAVPCCLDFQPSQRSDSADLIVGVSDGTVHLLSLRAQLLNPPGAKPVIAASLTPEAGQEVRCVAVVWLPKSDGMFAVALSNGNVHVYKKSAILGESSNRFSLGLGSTGKSTSPHSTITVSARGIHDLAASPCGTRIAAACCDGSLRIYDVPSGSMLGGCQSYYGAFLCCMFSPDGRFVAAGGEDDLVAVYSIAERFPILHLEGHNSWVSRVQWDPWLQYGSTQTQPGANNGASNGVGAGADMSGVYRLASVGQDAQLCLWDVQTGMSEGETLPFNSLQGLSGLSMRKSNSNHNIHGSPIRGDSGTPSSSNHQRKPSLGKFGGGGITPSLPRADMMLIQPSMEHKVHYEPMSDVVFTDQYIITADHCGGIRLWKRPGLARRSLTLKQGSEQSLDGADM